MSRSTAEAFFPATVDLLTAHPLGKAVWELALDDRAARQCPEVVILYPGIRSPYLGLASWVGGGIGLVGGVWMLSKSTAVFGRRNMVWPLALISFGLMNVSGFLIHSWYSEPKVNYIVDAPFLWAMDCYMTGLSSCSLVCGFLDALHPKRRRQWGFLFWILQGIGILSVAAFVLGVNANGMFGQFNSLPLEVWYILPSLVAAHFALEIMYFDQLYRRWHICAWWAAALAWNAGGIILDNTMCYTFGTEAPIWDLFQVTTKIFWSSNLAFVGILLWRLEEDAQPVHEHQSKKVS